MFLSLFPFVRPLVVRCFQELLDAFLSIRLLREYSEQKKNLEYAGYRSATVYPPYSVAIPQARWTVALMLN